MQQNVFLKSLGCPKNLVDSEIMAGLLKRRGYRFVSCEKEADVIIINTCAFIRKAEEESAEDILKLSEMKEKGRCSLLVVAGCLPKRYSHDVAKRFPDVDLFMGPGEVGCIDKLIDEATATPGVQHIRVGEPTFLPDHTTPRILSTPRYTAFVKVADGCSNQCSYCIIPKLRGPYRSRPIESIVAEVSALGEKGVKEVNLISQDTTRYGRDHGAGTTLTGLLTSLVTVRGIEWIRSLYCHPSGITSSLMRLLEGENKLVPYLDIPIQHISDRVLKRMGRKDGAAHIRKTISRLRERVPDISLRTTLMVGFPGETRKDFGELVRFVEETQFDHLGVFTYSPEEGTRAFRLEGNVEPEVAAERYHELMTIQAEISRKRNRKRKDTHVPVLIEGFSEESDLLLQGRTRFQAPEIDGVTYINKGTAEIGTITKVHITDAFEYDLVGEIVT